MNALSVSELTAQIKASLETSFSVVCVRGETGRVVHHASGHVYFSLKDGGATIDAVLFRANAAKLKFRLETGMQAIVIGGLSVYPPQGRYQIIAQSVEPDGAGALAAAYEQLKKKLAALGYFDESRKKPLPKYPKTIALVTSASGAALQDMLRVAQKRWLLTRLICINTIVQGEAAPNSVIRSIALADRLKPDAIVLARGGGSIEDLWSFNDENVARAMFEASTPIVSAIGHEIDFVITDFVADKRAPTPSAAMETLLPDMNEERMRLDDLNATLGERLDVFLTQKEGYLNHLKTMLKQLSPLAKIERNRAETAQLSARLDDRFRAYLTHRAALIDHLRAMLKQLSIAARIERFILQTEQLKQQLTLSFGFALKSRSGDLERLNAQLNALDPSKRLPVKTAQLILNGKVASVGELKPNDRFTIIDGRHSAIAEAKEIKPL
ncbi:MAG: exodeoxyribonuclease VII large subunit [Helicobacteraceae bacterium]|jgi:exodeoxyribonuclease VII large subunit|nr:exodeoxyribonuclease VII large subunit [Helicobacteraceae bacterium]